jgi:hypothetical protein
VNKTNLILTYDDDLTNRDFSNFNICFTQGKTKESECKEYPIRFNLIQGQKGKVNVILDNNMNEGKYYVRTNLTNEGISFIQEDKDFKVSEPLKFKFNHHYFVNNGDPENKLKIRLIDTNNINKFRCRIVETIDNKTLNNGSDNCTIFDYPINKEGTIRFNYSDNESFLIPINDSIVVVSNYSKLFLLNEKFCYYYLFDI